MRAPLLSLTLTLAFASAPLAAQNTQVDLLIKGGRVIDGTGSAPRTLDVGVRGDRIFFIGDASTAGITARRVIDAAGKVVAPGFIDPHTHTYGDLLSERRDRRQNAAYLMQGVTTVITGNDGGGPVDIAEHLARYAKDSIGTNAALFVGYGTLRGKVLGAGSGAANTQQLDQMREMVRTGMRGGALGLSTGLYYAPQSYGTTEEVIALAREAASAGGVYDSHLRDESSYTIGVLGAVAEAIRIGREAGLPVHMAHIKALGTDVWGQSDSIIALVKAAHARGQDVTADQYPYTASGSSVGASLLPRWAEAGGRDSLRARVNDPATKARLLEEMRVNLRRRNGPAAVLITGGRRPPLIGKTLEVIAKNRKVEPVVAALDIVLDGDAGIASFNMHEDDIAKLMVQPWVQTGSDGSDGHPRKYGTYPRKLQEYVLKRNLMPLETFVQRSSADVARALHIAERGTIALGHFADLIVFDPQQVRANATYEKPTELASGMDYVLVNGKVAVDKGTPTGVLAGRGLTRSGK